MMNLIFCALFFFFPSILTINTKEYYPGLSQQSISLSGVGYYSGYTSIVNTTKYPKRQLHQVFVENNNYVNSSQLPIFVFPMAYFPGVSSLHTLFNEYAPFTFIDQQQTEGQMQSIPYGLQYNPNHWAQQAHLLFIDPIPGVGLSYWSQTPPTNYNPTDSDIATDIYQILTSFSAQGGYPNNTYYIVANGYATRIATLLTQGWNTSVSGLKLGGLLLSNSIFQLYKEETSLNQQELNEIEYLNGHNFLGDAVYNSALACLSSYTNAVCQWAYGQIQAINKQLNDFNIFNYCYNDGVTPLLGKCQFNKGLYNLINDQYFQQAFYSHPNSTTGINFMNIFNTNILENYSYDYTNAVLTALTSIIQANSNNSLNICIYNGDVSFISNSIDTRYYLNQMSLKLQNNSPSQQLLTVKYPQPIGLQLGGIFTQYQGLLYAQIKKGGYFSAKDKPEATRALMKYYLTGTQEY